MDLDNIKKTWQETDLKPSVGEDKIQKMLNNTGKSALERLVKFEKLFLWLMVPCFFVGVLFYYMHHITGIIYFTSLALSLVWQLYKIEYLRRIDVSAMNVLKISKSVIRYRQYINYEIIGGAVFILVFFFSYNFYALPNIVVSLHKGHGNPAPFLDPITLFIISLVLSAIIIYLIYRFMYIKNIRSIRKSIEEIEDFEKDNQE